MNRIRIFLIVFISIFLWSGSVKANEYGFGSSEESRIKGAQTAKGTLASVDFKRKSFEILFGSVPSSIYFNGGTKFLRDGKSIFLSDILPGELIEVTYSARGKRKIARVVLAEGSRLLRIYQSTRTGGY